MNNTSHNVVQMSSVFYIDIPHIFYNHFGKYYGNAAHRFFPIKTINGKYSGNAAHDTAQ